MGSTRRVTQGGNNAVYMDGNNNEVAAVALGFVDVDNVTAKAVGPSQPMPVTTVRDGTPTITPVSAATSDTALAAADAARVGLTIYNNGSAGMWIRPGVDPITTSNGMYYLNPGDGYEIPGDLVRSAWRGIWLSAGGDARVTARV